MNDGSTLVLEVFSNLHEMLTPTCLAKEADFDELHHNLVKEKAKLLGRSEYWISIEGFVRYAINVQDIRLMLIATSGVYCLFEHPSEDRTRIVRMLFRGLMARATSGPITTSDREAILTGLNRCRSILNGIASEESQRAVQELLQMVVGSTFESCVWALRDVGKPQPNSE